jgi:putative endonuclease
MKDLPSIEHHYVYIVQCTNGSLYTGYSKNIVQRIAVHNAGKGGRYTRAHRPVELLAYCQFATKSEALRAEYTIKQLPRHQKLAFIKKQHLDLINMAPSQELSQQSNDTEKKNTIK